MKHGFLASLAMFYFKTISCVVAGEWGLLISTPNDSTEYAVRYAVHLSVSILMDYL